MSVDFSHLTLRSITKKDEQKQAIQDYHIPSISDTIKISDSRKLKDFKDQVFGGYKLTAAAAALEKALLEDKIEPTLHWILQLFLSGIIQPLWVKLLNFAAKAININNPMLPEFIYNKTVAWQHITDNSRFTGNKDEILQLRNHPSIRLLLAEMGVIIALSKKRKLNTLPRIKKEEFIIDNFKSKLVAKDNSITDGLFQDGDPSEIRIAANEFAYHLYHGNLSKSLYWLNWILEWEKINTKKYGKYECATRSIQGVDGKFYKDVVWLIWVIINKLRIQKLALIQITASRQMEYLWKIYITKFTPSARSRKQPLIIWAMLYLTENIDMSIPLVDRPAILFQSLLGIDKIVASLKSQEVQHIVNPNIMNVIVENNYMVPENYKQLEANQLRIAKERERDQITKEQHTKQKKVNEQRMQKLNDIYKLDRMMYA
jgi:hypothetical protein